MTKTLGLCVFLAKLSFSKEFLLSFCCYLVVNFLSLHLACTAAYLASVPSAICPDRCTA